MTPEQRRDVYGYLNDALPSLKAATKVRTEAGGDLMSLSMALFYVKDAIAEMEKEMDDASDV